MSFILGFSGLRRSGKTTCSQLVRDFIPNFKPLSFSGTLKWMYSMQTGVPVDKLNDPNTKELYRADLIHLADLEKAKNPNVFTEKLFEQIEEDDLVVIDDVRYIHELATVCRAGGKIYKVVSNLKCRTDWGYKYDPFIDTDRGETELGELPNYTFTTLGGVIWNMGTIDELALQIQDILCRLT